MARVKVPLNTPLKKLLRLQEELCDAHPRIEGWVIVTNGRNLYILSDKTKLRPNETYWKETFDEETKTWKSNERNFGT